MKTEQDLRQFYESTLKTELMELDAKRAQLVRNFYKNTVFIILGYIAVSVLVTLVTGGLDPVIPAAVWGVGFMAMPFAIYFNYRKWRFGYPLAAKETVMNLLVPFIDPNLKFDEKGMVSLDEYFDSGLFLREISNYYGEDLVHGKIDNTPIQFSEFIVKKASLSVDPGTKPAHEERPLTADSLQNVNVKSGTIKGARHGARGYQGGVILSAELNTTVTSSVFIFAERDYVASGGSLSSLMGDTSHSVYGPNIDLGKPEFHKKFTVYSNSEEEAHRICNETFVKRLLAFHEVNKYINYSMSFRGNKIYMYFEVVDDLYEAPFFNHIHDYSYIKKTFGDLIFFCGVIKVLGLDV